jgi:hypothetical protein
LAVSGARAQAEGPGPAATELFRQGRELIKQGDWTAGCNKLALSMKRYPAPSTLMNIARCRVHEGRVASAWALYQRSLVLNRETPGEERRKELEAVGQTAIDELQPRLPRILVVVEPPREDVRVSEGGRALPVGTAVPLDPGSYLIEATAPGFAPSSERVSLSEGATTSVTLKLRALAPTPVSAPPPPTPAPQPDRIDTDEEPPVWLWLVGAAGIAMTGVAIGFAVDSRNATDDLASRCGADLVCDEDLAFDPSDLNGRKNRGLGLSIGFGIGGATALTASIVGLLTW